MSASDPDLFATKRRRKRILTSSERGADCTDCLKFFFKILTSLKSGCFVAMVPPLSHCELQQTKMMDGWWSQSVTQFINHTACGGLCVWLLCVFHVWCIFKSALDLFGEKSIQFINLGFFLSKTFFHCMFWRPTKPDSCAPLSALGNFTLLVF